MYFSIQMKISPERTPINHWAGLKGRGLEAAANGNAGAAKLTDNGKAARQCCFLACGDRFFGSYNL